MEKMVTGLLRVSLAGGISIVVFGLLSWILQKRYKAQGRKNGWIIVSVCLLLPLNLISFPNVSVYTVQIPNFIIADAGSIHSMDGNASQMAAHNGGEGTNSTENFTVGVSTEEILFIVWSTGVLIMVLYHTVCYYKLCRRMKRWSHECNDSTVFHMIKDIGLEIGMKVSPQIKIMEVPDSGPFTMGILKNTIFLPNRDIVGKNLYYILKHELVHCRKKDTVWKLLFLTANIVHWFNPLAWLMRRLAENDMEQACDEEVVKNASKKECREYSDAILLWAGSGMYNSLSTGYAADKIFLKRRFANIYESSQKRYSISLMVILCIIVFGVSSMINVERNEMTKSNIPLESFWIRENSKNENVLQFVTGLEVVLPEEWIGKVVLDTDIGPQYDPYVNTLTVCEKTNAEEQCGVLFYIEFATYDKGVISYTSNTVLGLYKQGDMEYVLSFFEPHDLQYVEGDVEKKVAYENLFSQIDEIQVVTKNMAGFTVCTIDDLEWLRDESEAD